MSNYVDSFKSFSNKEAKAIKEQAQDVPMDIPSEFQSEQTNINNLKNTIATAEQDLAQKKADLNRLTQELQNKIAAKKQQDAQKAQAAQQQPAV